MATLARKTELEALWRAFQEAPSASARDRLVVAYSPLVQHLAARLSHSAPVATEASMLIPAGVLGLIDAVESFEPGSDTHFEAYALGRVRARMTDQMRAADWVPDGLTERFAASTPVEQRVADVERVAALLGDRLNRLPSDEEVAAELGIHESTVRRIFQDAAGEMVERFEELLGLPAVRTASAAGTAQSAAGSFGAPQERLTNAISALPDREKLVVALSYYENLTDREIGEVLGITPSAIRGLKRRALGRLRSAVKPRRMPGSLRGQIKMAEDFDVLPADFIEHFE